MSERMPDFAMPSDDELAAEQDAGAIAAAGSSGPGEPLGPEPAQQRSEPLGRERVGHADAGSTSSASDPATRDAARLRDRVATAPRAARRRLLAAARNPVVAFASGAAIVAAGFLAAPGITAWTERGSQAELERVVEEYAAAVTAGDVEAALAFHRPDEDLASVALLDAGVAPTALPSVSCEAPEARTGRDVAVARCSLGVDGWGAMGGGTQLRLERIDGGWQVMTGLAQLTWIAPAMFDLVSISGVPMADVLDPDEQQYWVLPGGYDVETRTSDLMQLTDLGGLVVGQGGGSLGVYAAPGDAIVEAAESAALEFAQGCVVDAATAASCGLVPPPPGQMLSAVLGPQGYGLDATDFGMAIRIQGTGAAVAPNVEVIVRFSDDWTTYELDVTGVTEQYG